MKRLLAISAFLFASSAFAAPNLTGQWTIHNNIAGNENEEVCELAVTDNKITGSCKSQDKDLPVMGTVDGNKVTWQFQSDYNGSPLTLIYKATLGDSNKIAGTVEVQPFGITGDFTAATSSASSQSGRTAAGQSGLSAVTGQWSIHNNIAGNENDLGCKLVTTDNKITGSCKSQDKDLPVTGTVDGNKVTWQFQSDYNGSPITLIYKATLGDSNKIAGTVEVQPFGITGDFTATTSSASSQPGQATGGQSGSGQQSAVTGQWTIHSNIAGSETDQICKLAVADNKITGSCKSQDKDLPVTGTVDGNKATWQYQVDYNGSPLTLIYTATLDNSGKIAGTVEVKPYGVTGDFTAATSSASSQSGQAVAGQSGSEDAAAEQLLVVQAGPGGIFKNQADVGKANPAGTASFDAKSGVYTIESAGMNLWNKADAFHVIWKKVSGDVSLTADVELAAPSSAKSNPHRKAVVMFRQTLDADSATAYVAVHGSGYTALQYRPTKGALTQEIAFDPEAPNSNPTQSRAASLAHSINLAVPKTVRLEKRGDTITLFVSMKGEPLHPTGASIKLHFEEPFYVGLGVASHQDGQLEKAAFSHVELKPLNAVASAYVALERPKITGLSHLAVYTSNPEAADQFYRGVIGAVKLSDPENPQGVRYALSDTQFVEVLPLPAGAGINRLDHSAWNTDNAEQLRRYLAANNWKTPDKVEKGSDGSRWFEVFDPEGNKVQFVQLPPHSKPLVAPDATGHHIIHIGFLVHSREAEDKFYRTLLDFRPYWWGGRSKGKVDWVSQQSPDSPDWLEYMLVADPGTGIPANMNKMYLGVLDHFSIGEASVDDTLAKLKESGRLVEARRLMVGVPVDDHTQVGLDGKGQYNLFDPDGIRVEFMNFHHTTEPCCSPFTAPDPSK
jgi:catechol 2,3-dioxygenase-like lactoylglutathione lyase family enzyme